MRHLHRMNLKIFALTMCVSLMTFKPILASGQNNLLDPNAPNASPTNEPYSTFRWGSKYRYGLRSTLVTSYLLGPDSKHNELLTILNSANYDASIAKAKMAQLWYTYGMLTRADVNRIVSQAEQGGTQSIYQPFRTYLHDSASNTQFINLMPASIYTYQPVDNHIQNGRFINYNKQFNAHRSVYNAAYGIPQNSIGAILSGYIAGIRSFEIDVLQTKDNKCAVIHDLVTNRLSGAFNYGPAYVENLNYSQIEPVSMSILNPLGEVPSAQSTPVKRIATIEDVYKFIKYLAPTITLYVDARNNSPACAINALKQFPEVKDNVVIKVYPFSLKAGAADLETEYAKVANLTAVSARQEIARINPNLLLVIGSAPTQASDLAQANQTQYNNVDYSKFLAATKYLPHARAGRGNDDCGVSFCSPPGTGTSPIPETIEARTWNTFQWMAGFYSIANPLVLQVSILPCVSCYVKEGRVNELSQIPLNNIMDMMVVDNIMYLHAMIKSVHPATNFWQYQNFKSNQNLPMSDMLAGTVYGMSDRFPDFSFLRDGKLRDFNYHMGGYAYEANDYAAQAMRSTKAIKERFELHDKYFGSSAAPMSYITTDLPEDLTAMYMGVSGYPDDLKYRTNGLIINNRTPSDIASYTLPDWVTHLFGDLYRQYGNQFLTNYGAAGKAKNDYDAISNSVHILQAAQNKNILISDTYLLSLLSAVDKQIYHNPMIGYDHPKLSTELSPITLNTALLQANNRMTLAAINANMMAGLMSSQYGYKFEYIEPPPYEPVAPD